jgi:hypothetical protein
LQPEFFSLRVFSDLRRQKSGFFDFLHLFRQQGYSMRRWGCCFVKKRYLFSWTQLVSISWRSHSVKRSARRRGVADLKARIPQHRNHFSINHVADIQ